MRQRAIEEDSQHQPLSLCVYVDVQLHPYITHTDTHTIAKRSHSVISYIPLYSQLSSATDLTLLEHLVQFSVVIELQFQWEGKHIEKKPKRLSEPVRQKEKKGRRGSVRNQDKDILNTG